MISIWYQVCLYSTARWRKMSIWNFYSEIWPYNISDHQFSSRSFQPLLVSKIIYLELKTKNVFAFLCIFIFMYLYFGQASSGRRRPRRPRFSNSVFSTWESQAETPAIYLRWLLTKQGYYGWELGRPRRILGREPALILGSTHFGFFWFRFGSGSRIPASLFKIRTDFAVRGSMQHGPCFPIKKYGPI